MSRRPLDRWDRQSRGLRLLRVRGGALSIDYKGQSRVCQMSRRPLSSCERQNRLLRVPCRAIPSVPRPSTVHRVRDRTLSIESRPSKVHRLSRSLLQRWERPKSSGLRLLQVPSRALSIENIQKRTGSVHRLSRRPLKPCERTLRMLGVRGRARSTSSRPSTVHHVCCRPL